MPLSTRPLLISLLVLGCQPEDSPTGGSGGGGGSSSRQGVVRAPLLGGTVTVAAGGDFAVVSDPERDLATIIDVPGRSVRGVIRFPTGSQPTRGVEDNRGQVRLVLRGSGQIATLSLGSAALVRTDSVCPEPRSAAWDSRSNALVVACASGELVTMPTLGSMSVRRFDADLRDVLVRDGKVRVSTFRSAQLIDVEDKPRTLELPSIELPPVRDEPTRFVPTVAWRTVAAPGDLTVTVHQRSVEGDIDAIRSGLPPVVVPYYTNPCSNAVVRSALTVSNQERVLSSVEIPGVLPVDVAVSPDGTEVAVVGAGNSELVRLPLSSVMQGISGGVCGPVARTAPSFDEQGRPTAPLGQPVGLGFVANGQLLVHSRSPARVTLLPASSDTKDRPVTLDLEGAADSQPTGFRLFHTSAGGLACASCHPEGQEDGHVWTFFAKKRRTQPLSGGLSQTAPFHWKGDLPDLTALVDDTYVSRMGGTPPEAEDVASLSSWLDSVPVLKAPTRAMPVDMARGRAAFEKAGCESCHSGTRMTNRATSNVGTGEPFQVPALKGLSRRAPFMHDGCAKTLGQRFDDPSCGGRSHGDTSKLSAVELSALTAWLGQL